MWLTLALASMAFADAPFIDKPIFGGPGVGLGATVTNASLDSVYGKILQYNFQYMAINEMEAIENRLADRVFWEFHMGVGAYEPKTMYKIGYLGCKMNLSGGKIADAKRLRARLAKLRSYVQLSGSRSMDQKAFYAKIENLEQQADAYNRQFLWKRVGVAFWVPIWGEYHQSEQTTQDSSLPSRTMGEGTSSAELYKDFSKSAVALTYDLGDLASLSLGVNLSRSLFLGVSVDISTPASDFVSSFRSELKNNFQSNSGLPGL